MARCPQPTQKTASTSGITTGRWDAVVLGWRGKTRAPYTEIRMTHARFTLKLTSSDLSHCHWQTTRALAWLGCIPLLQNADAEVVFSSHGSHGRPDACTSRSLYRCLLLLRASCVCCRTRTSISTTDWRKHRGCTSSKQQTPYSWPQPFNKHSPPVVHVFNTLCLMDFTRYYSIIHESTL